MFHPNLNTMHTFLFRIFAAGISLLFASQDFVDSISDQSIGFLHKIKLIGNLF